MKKIEWKIKNNEVEIGLLNYVKSPILARLLVNRGITTKEEAKLFLNPKDIPFIDPFKFLDMQKAIDRIKRAVDNKEKILVWGDFDADGVTSTSLLYKVFKKIGADFTYFIPNRKEMGHGLNSGELLKYISKEKVKLVITVDCGISNINEANILKSFNVDLIITDHHKAEENVPLAYAIIDANAPNTIDNDLSIRDTNSLCYLAGVGVAYKVAQALEKYYPEIKEIDEELLCLACVGTIADVAPLLNENRTLVALGLDLINKGVHKGISKLFEICGKQENISSTDIAFILAPRINAMGRLKDVKLPFELLAETHPENFETIIETLNQYNKIRQSICIDMTLSIKEKAMKDNNPVIVEYNPEWHIGIIGITASNIVEATSKPTFLMTKNEDDDVIRCSIRSPKEYNVYDVLTSLKDNFLGYGGHALAGGFSFDSKKIPFDEMKEKIISTFKEMYYGVDVRPTIDVDMELNGNDITEDLLEDIKALEPTGEMNPKPVFCIKDVQYLTHKFVGKESGNLKLECKKDGCNLHCVWWGQDKFKANSDFDILFYPRLNVFNGIRTVQLELSDISSNYQEEVKIFDHRMKTKIMPEVDKYLARKDLSLDIYIKKANTIESVKEFKNINHKINFDNTGIMFFDYPPTSEEFKRVIKNKEYQKIHLMKEEFDEDILNYIKKILGMTKYAHNKKQGEIDIEKMAEMLGVTKEFVQVTLEIFERENAIKIKDEKTLEYIGPISDEQFKKSTMFEVLEDEFNKILEFKKFINNASVEEIQKGL